MKQLIVNELYEEGKIFKLGGKPSRYLSKVRRVDIGDALDLLCDNNISCTATVCELSNEEIFLKMGSPLIEKRGEFLMTLVFALLKGKKNDEVIRRAVEVGASQIYIVRAEHSVYSVKEEREKGRLERWQKIATEAGQQSGNSQLVKVVYCSSWEEYFSMANPNSFGLVCHEKKLGNETIHSHIANYLSRNNNTDSLVLFVGPEGGFSDKELELFKNKNYLPMWMGPTVMRAENASITALSIISLLLLEKDAWCLEMKKK